MSAPTISVARHTGLDVLRDCLRSASAVADVLDIPIAEAKRWAKAAEVYFGTTRYTRQQRFAVEAAAGASITRLMLIERYCRRVDNPSRRWAFRLSLLRISGRIEKVADYAREHIEEFTAPREPQRGVRVNQNSEQTWTLSIRDDPKSISTLVKSLEAAAGDGPEKREHKLADAFWDLLHTNSGLVTPAYRTVIAVGLDDAMRILAGAAAQQRAGDQSRGETAAAPDHREPGGRAAANGDGGGFGDFDPNEIRLGCSDGTTMTGAQWLQACLDGECGEEIFAGLFHPVAGPVNLYSARFANFKQRILAMAEQLVCAWGDCHVPSDRCEVHHITPHSEGGLTRPDNLTMLCRYHNGVAGRDGPPDAGGSQQPPRGWVERRDGKVGYRPPRGGYARPDTHPTAHKGAMDLI